MARSVADLALYLSALAGPDPRSPISIEEAGTSFAAPLDCEMRGVRVAWWTGLGGVPIDRRVRALVDAQRTVFESMGCHVEREEPDFADADEVFMTLRAIAYIGGLGDLVEAHRDQVKDTVRWEIDRAGRLTARDVGRMEAKRTTLHHRMRAFFERYDVFALPVAQVPPFDVTQPYPTEIDGVPMANYIDWVRVSYYISATGHPAISVPCGFTDEGLPVGLQLVGRYHGDRELLQIAHGYEQARALERRVPAALNTKATKDTKGTKREER
jgi:amidase